MTLVRWVLELLEHKETAQCLERTKLEACVKSWFSYFLPVTLGLLNNVSQHVVWSTART